MSMINKRKINEMHALKARQGNARDHRQGKSCLDSTDDLKFRLENPMLRGCMSNSKRSVCLSKEQLA